MHQRVCAEGPGPQGLGTSQASPSAGSPARASHLTSGCRHALVPADGDTRRADGVPAGLGGQMVREPGDARTSPGCQGSMASRHRSFTGDRLDRLHPIDGARWLPGARRRRGARISRGGSLLRPDRGGALRGRTVLLDEFSRHPSLPHDELCFCDLTTSSDGEFVTPRGRLVEIRRRYPDGYVVRSFNRPHRGRLARDLGPNEGSVRGQNWPGLAR